MYDSRDGYRAYRCLEGLELLLLLPLVVLYLLRSLCAGILKLLDAVCCGLRSATGGAEEARALTLARLLDGLCGLFLGLEEGLYAL